ncbi:ethanolamine kinase 1-like isoform X2 [Tubulanus polymorphus]|uniref:ethanolamine kinase 1-like isoform X2 n=1 Tax=Tubulanus polymorphus TaxID=672921 RepID=UPI003DA5C2EE
MWSSEITVFTDGITNKLIGCYVGAFDDVVLIRIYGKKTELIIDRQAEQMNMRLLNSIGAAKPLYCVYNNGLAYGFIHGSVTDDVIVRDPHVSGLIAREMALIHSIKYSDIPNTNGRPCESSYFNTLKKYLALRPKSFDDPDKNNRFVNEVPSVAKLETELRQLRDVVESFGASPVFSHNDLLLKNMVYNKKDDRTYFIDYEYAAFNYYGYDIGNHFCEWAGLDVVDYDKLPKKDEQLPWLRKYLEYKHDIEGRSDAPITEELVETLYEQVQVFMLMAHLFWGMWAVIQAAHSTLDFDFLDYAVVRFNEYFREKNECILVNRV